MDESGRIGVDESGKGDYFGPLVIAACYVGPEHEAELEGVCDSKKLSDAQALRLSGVIREVCPHAVVAVGPEKYNQLYAKIGNLNRLLEWGHAQAIQNCRENVDCRRVISDRFANPQGLERTLKAKGIDVDLTSMVRAESDLAVAAASILARAEFLRRLERLGGEIGTPLPKGAGAPVLAAARRLAPKLGREGMAKIAKMHFRTTGQAFGG